MDETNPYLSKRLSNTDLTNVISPTAAHQDDCLVPKPFRLLFPAIDSVQKYEAKLLTDPMFLFSPISLCADCFAKLIEGRDEFLQNNQMDDSEILQVPPVS